MALPIQIDEWFRAGGFCREEVDERFVSGSAAAVQKIMVLQLISAASSVPPEFPG